MIRSVPARVAGSRIAAAWAASRAQVPFAPAVGVRSAATYAKILDKVLGVDVHNKEKVVARHELDSIYDKPVSLPATHGIPVCRVALWSFQLQRIDFYVDFCRKAAYHMGVSCSGAVPMPTVIRRWTVLRSPFVHKSSMEVFERRTRKRVMFVRDTDPAVVEKWLTYIHDNIPVGIGMKYWLHEHEPLDIGDRIGKALQTGDTRHVDAQSLESTRYLEHVVQRGRRRLWTTYKDLPVYSRDAVAAMAGDIAAQLKANPRANIEEITNKVVMATRPPKEEKERKKRARQLQQAAAADNTPAA